MIDKPEDKLEWFGIRPGEYVSVHYESSVHTQRVLAKIREKGAKPMLALNPATPLCVLEDVIGDIDGVLIMTVNPGFAGQALVPQTISKISRLKKWLADKGKEHIEIEVDGNVSFANAKLMRDAGADIFVAGSSSVFAEDMSLEDAAAKLRANIT
jgi:ribulose-phosphate 3-epimerase